MQNSRIRSVPRKLDQDKSINIPMERFESYIDDALTPSMRDAESEIIEIFELTTKHLDYVSFDPSDQSRGKSYEGDDVPDYTPRQKEILKAYSQYKRENKMMLSIALNVAKNMTSPEKLIKSVKVNGSIDDKMKKVASIYAFCLNEWCILRGFGDQTK